MQRRIPIFLSAIAGIAVLQSNPAVADESTRSEELPLSEQELRGITDQVLAREPMLSSSPGIKFADAIRLDGSEDIANVIFYPHLASAGIKEAYQVECFRQVPVTAWTCKAPEIRRYLSLDSQDYEVRVTGPISADAAVAFLEATRKLLPARDNANSDVPDTAMQLRSYPDSASAVWVNFEGRAHQIIIGRVTEGGDPALADDWVVELWNLE